LGFIAINFKKGKNKDFWIYLIEVIIDLDQECPISLKDLEDLINRVHSRYPFIEKYKISLIIKSFFEILRELMVEGKSVSINGFFSNMKLIYFIKNRQHKKVYHSKIKLSTPKSLK
jgi:nucleoid DNA-binding protein